MPRTQVSALCAAFMSVGLGGANWGLLLLFCASFGTAIFGHYAVGPPLLAK